MSVSARILWAVAMIAVTASGSPAAPKTTCDYAGMVQKGDEQSLEGTYAAAIVSWEGAYACKADPMLARKLVMAACNAKNVAKAKLYFARVDEGIKPALRQACVRNGVDLDAAPATPPCDADGLRQKGEDHLQTGMDAAALAAFEASMKCRPDDAVLRFAFMAACRSRNAAKSRFYYDKLPATTTKGIREICARNGIELGASPTPPACDADALRKKGEEHLQTGMDAAALAAFEASMKCRPDGALLRFAFMAACRSKNEAKSRFYYGKLPPATTDNIRMICVRNGIDLPGAKQEQAPPPARP